MACRGCKLPNRGSLCATCTAIAADRKTAERKAPQNAKKPPKRRKERWELVGLRGHDRPAARVELEDGEWDRMKGSWG